MPGRGKALRSVTSERLQHLVGIYLVHTQPTADVSDGHSHHLKLLKSILRAFASTFEQDSNRVPSITLVTLDHVLGCYIQRNLALWILKKRICAQIEELFDEKVLSKI